MFFVIADELISSKYMRIRWVFCVCVYFPLNLSGWLRLISLPGIPQIFRCTSNLILNLLPPPPPNRIKFKKHFSTCVLNFVNSNLSPFFHSTVQSIPCLYTLKQCLLIISNAWCSLCPPYHRHLPCLSCPVSSPLLPVVFHTHSFNFCCYFFCHRLLPAQMQNFPLGHSSGLSLARPPLPSTPPQTPDKRPSLLSSQASDISFVFEFEFFLGVHFFDIVSRDTWTWQVHQVL